MTLCTRREWLFYCMCFCLFLGCDGESGESSTSDALTPNDVSVTMDRGQDAFDMVPNDTGAVSVMDLGQGMDGDAGTIPVDVDGGMIPADAGGVDPMGSDAGMHSGRAEKSEKRGIAFGFNSARDLEALSEGVSWWYNWSPSYNDVVADHYMEYGVDWVPMTWNGNNPDAVRTFLDGHPSVRYLLGFNEPNFSDQANMTPAYAASLWPIFEAIAEEYNVELVGPAVNFCGGCVQVDGVPLGNDYIIWLDLFLEAYRSQFGREPRIDYMALHWYDFGLEDQVNRLVERYGKPVWVTEFALWRGEEWNTDEFERNWLLDMVQFLEAHPMVHRYAWFTGRRDDFPRINLLGADGELTPLGRAYVDAPF